MSSFGPMGNWRNRPFACHACCDEIPHRAGVSLEARYPMRGPICGHRWPRFAYVLPEHKKRLLDAGVLQKWIPVKVKGGSR